MKRITLLLVLAFAGSAMAQHMSFNSIIRNHSSFMNAHREASSIVAKQEKQISFLSTVSLLDSEYHWSWDTASTSWEIKNKSIYSYDINNNEISEVNQMWYGAQWGIN